MRRIALVLGLMAGVGSTAWAGQSSASFHVGITILPQQQALSVRKARLSTNPFLRSLVRPVHYTWGAASVSLAQAGFTGLVRDGQVEFVYFFRARRGGEWFRVAVSASTGGILKVWPA